MESKVLAIIEQASDSDLANLIIDSYKEVEKHYFVKQWKTSELDAGHFVEAVRRFIELRLNGKYTPIGKSLSSFNDKTMQAYLNESGDDSYRIHIPRVLLSIYGIRNKRGVGHVSLIAPNYLDATYIIASAKWVLAELIRLNSTLSADETSKIVDHIVERDVEGVWEQGEVTRILVDGLSLKEQILFLLVSTDTSTEDKLMSIIEAKDKGYFRKLLKQLHAKRLIEYKADGTCVLSPKGKLEAEQLILSKVKA